MCESVRPIHQLLPDLVELYTNNALAASNSATSSVLGLSGAGLLGGCVPFSEEELSSLFSPKSLGPMAASCAPTGEFLTADIDAKEREQEERDLTPQLLFLYYMLYIYHQELSMRIADGLQRK